MTKKLIYSLFFLFIISCTSLNAQAFQKGKLAVNAGGSVLLIGNITPGANLSLEYGIVKISKKLTFAAGIEAEVLFIDPDILGYHGGVRTTLHWGTRDTRSHDVYGGLSLGLPLYDEHNYAYPVYFNQFLGVRFLFKRRYGVFAEAGLGSTNIRAGLSVILFGK